jgi:hypothetical protein
VLLRNSLLGGALALGLVATAGAQVTVSIDAAADQHPIDPRIYGVAFAGPAALDDLGATLNRWGGNTSSRYNWQQNIDNRGADWFFESLAFNPNVPGQAADSFITDSRAGGAEPMLTFPMCDWIAKAGPGYTDLWSFSVAKYGAQQSTDFWRPDAGNGVLVDGTVIDWNDMSDANMQNTSALQNGWFQHVVGTWGPASANGLKYWFYDNESSIWFSTHRDVVRQGKSDDQYIDLVKEYGARARASDPGVQLFGPEEWGWSAYFFSGYDQWYGPSHGWQTPNHDAHGDFIPYLLDQLRTHEQTTGERLLDGLTLHFYPQSGEFGSDVSTSMQLLRNRSTRGLWDPNYLNESSWIDDYVRLIPRMKDWVATHYPGLKTGITEYNWGAEDHMNGATTQADILGIFGREGLDLATRWTTPESATPTYKAMKMYRNYDGSHAAFGETSARATVPDPDTLSAFAALRGSDGALTVMVIDKALSGSTPLTLALAGFAPGAIAQRWQLAANAITHLADVPISGATLQATLPAPSVTLFVIPGASALPPSLSISDTSVPEGDSGAANAVFQVTLSAASASPVSVSYATADGSATAGSDYTSAGGTLSFAPGSTSGSVLVPVLGDTTPEPIETFTVTLSAPVSATLGDAQAVGTIVDDDGGAPPLLELAHGFRTTRDFGAGAAHLFHLRQAPRSSYEVVVDGLSGDLGAAGPLLRRLASDLTTVLSDSLPAGSGKSRTLAWENASGAAVQGEYVLVQSAGCSACTPSDAYRIRAYETTASIARFNDSANQVTVLVLESRAARTLAGHLHFWGPQGALLASSPFTLGAGATLSLNTSTVPGVLGQSGSVTVSHDGRYGDLAGKAVAVEPSTGFTFDTPLGYRPR